MWNESLFWRLFDGRIGNLGQNEVIPPPSSATLIMPAPLPTLSLLSLATLALGWVPQTALAFVFADSNGADASRWSSTSFGSTGSAGDPIQLSWSFVPDGTLVRGFDEAGDIILTATEPSDLIADLDSFFGAGSGGSDLTQRPWFTYFEQSFDRISELSGVNFVYEPNDNALANHGSGTGITGIRGDLRIGGISMDGSGGTLAYNYFPFSGGDMAIDTDDLTGLLGNSANNYRTLRNTIMHESLHGLGLEHTSSSDSEILTEPTIQTTIDGPQHDDLRGIHTMYGDLLEQSAGVRNDTAANATSLLNLFAGSSKVVGAGGSGTVVDPGETDFVSISNEDDVDFFSFTLSSTASVDLSMTPRGATYLQDPTQFNTTTTNDLELALFDTNGTSLIQESTSGAAGVAEEIEDVVLQPGTYYARVQSTGTAETVAQFYQLNITAAATAPALVGDFNGDGFVNALDYTVWTSEFGLFRTPFTGADHSGDGEVNAADYTLWASNYGASLAGSAFAVPEPATAGMLLIFTVCLLGRRTC